jgi:hypothetical protein
LASLAAATAKAFEIVEAGIAAIVAEIAREPHSTRPRPGARL